MKCVEIDLNGFVVESVSQVPPSCSEFMLMTPVEFNRMTFWADLAIELDPTGATFYTLLTAFFAACGIVLGTRMAFDQLRAVTKEA